jgi:hypothetical protein
MNDEKRRQAAAARRDDMARSVAQGGSGRRPGARPGSGGAVMTVGRATLAASVGRRPVDVICAGMYRACSTWQYEVVAHLVERHRDGRRLGYLTPEQYAGPKGQGAADGGPRPATGDGWCVFKSHDRDRCFARAIAQGRAIVIYAYRDVRDVVFSLMHKRRLTFEQLLRQGMIHQVFANDRFWTRQPNVIVQRYDEILADPVGAIRALADHLGIRPADGEAERLANEYSLAANKARTEALRLQLEQNGVDLNEAAHSLICDSTTLLHWNHVRDGRSGSWFVESTPRQRIVLQRLCGRWLAARGYPAVPDGMSHDAAAGPGLPIGARIGIEIDILRGWLSCKLRAASQRFPRLAATAKRMLGIADASQAGAVVWSESQPDVTDRSRERQRAV